MALTKREAIDKLRADTVERFINYLQSENDDAQQTKTGTIMFPTVDAAGNECFITVTVQIPKGSREGEPYDGYEEAKNYLIEKEQKEKAKKEREIAKQKKIQRDAATRKKKAEKENE